MSMSDASPRAEKEVPSTATSTLIAPTKQEERITTLDALRGFALLGVLITNMLQGYSFVRTEADEVVATLIRAFAEGTFYPMFSFLFGLGFALQLRKGDAVLPRFRRRLALLLGIGSVHLLLIWAGDILFTYAVLGFVLVLFRNKGERTLLIAALLMWLFTLILYVFNGEFLIPEPQPSEFLEPSGNTYFSAVVGRLEIIPLELLNLFLIGPAVLALFLVGYALGRRGVQSVLENERFLRRTALTCTLLAAPFTLWLLGALPLFEGTGWMYALEFLVASPLLGFAYLAALSLFAQPLQHLLKPFVPIGQMALSNYLGQSLICTTLFYPYTFGLWGLGAAATFPISLAIFAFQIAFSAWWLRRYRFGPAEWVWRSLTYGKRQPLRRAESSAHAV